MQKIIRKLSQGEMVWIEYDNRAFQFIPKGDETFVMTKPKETKEEYSIDISTDLAQNAMIYGNEISETEYQKY